MGISPSGNRRQMEAQQYVHVEQASSIINKLFDKVADTLNLGRDSLSPQSLTTPDTPTNSPVNDAMNQSNSLPPKDTLSPKSPTTETKPEETAPTNDDIVVLAADGSPKSDAAGQLAKQILQMLKEKGFGSGGAYVLNRFDVSKGIEISATPKAGPAVSKG